MIKQFKDFLPNITEQQYRELDAINYSLLKVFIENGPEALIKPQPEVFGDGVTLGTIVDKRLSDDGYNPYMEYTVADIDIDFSGDTHISKIYKFLRNNSDIILKDKDEDTLQRIFKILEFNRPPKVTDEFWVNIGYINQMNSGRKFISPSEIELAGTMVNTFKNHPYTLEIFNPELGIEVLNQCSFI